MSCEAIDVGAVDLPVEMGGQFDGVVDRLTELFWNVMHTAAAILTELYAMTLYSWYLFACKHIFSLKSYGLNPEKLTEKQLGSQAVLFLHGDPSWDWTGIPLAREMQKQDVGPAFTLQLTYDDKNPEAHQQKIADKVQEIAKLYLAQGKELKKLVIVGHSKGGIEAIDYVRRVYERTEKSSIDYKIVTIASRLKVTVNENRVNKCHPELKPLVNRVHQFIKTHPEFPLYNIVAERDWKVPVEAAKIVQDPSKVYVSKNLSHLSIAFFTTKKAVEFVLA